MLLLVSGNYSSSISRSICDPIHHLRDCTITWYAVRRPSDISSNIATSTYVAALMVEDFANMTSNTPMSSVPIQMYDESITSLSLFVMLPYLFARLVFVYRRPTGACHTVPAIIGDRPNRACIGQSLIFDFVNQSTRSMSFRCTHQCNSRRTHCCYCLLFRRFRTELCHHLSIVYEKNSHCTSGRNYQSMVYHTHLDSN